MGDPTTETVTIGLPTAFSVTAVVDFLLRPEYVTAWLGTGASLGGEVGDPVVVPALERGRVVEIRRNPSTCVLRAVWDAPASGTDGEAALTIRVTTRPGGRSRVRVTESGLPSGLVHARVRFWTHTLAGLGEILDVASAHRRRFRQAVVVVHGIGEQRPSTTLRNFVQAAFPETRRTRRFVKPDYVSPLVGATSVTVPGRWSMNRPTTDVYELYWAHLLRDTTVGQVYSWALRLVLLTPRRNISQQLRPHAYAVRAVIALAVAAILAFVVAALAGRGPGASVAALTVGAVALLAVVPGIVWKVARLFGSSLQNVFVANILGDAARYLDPSPANVAVRQSIRETGLQLIEDLHERGRYGRIIVYGHSLGSVIAYDILAHVWTRRSRSHAGAEIMRTPSLRAVEDLLNPRPAGAPPPDLATVRERQHLAWQEHAANGFSWLVSDLITAGSPLTHARWLLNPDKKTPFDQLVADRSLPTCPPQAGWTRSPVPGRRRRTFTFTHAYRAPGDPRARSVLVPDHAAMFALVRWTNLYFPLTGVMRGDPVGGPLAGSFGGWVRDVPLPHPGTGFAGFAHTKYVDTSWRSEHVDRLRAALELSVTFDVDYWFSQPDPPAPG